MVDSKKETLAVSFYSGGYAKTIIRIVMLPLVPLLLVLACDSPDGGLLQVPRLPCSPLELWDGTAFLVVLGWCLLQCALYSLPMGTVAEGTPLKSGKRLKYNLNGVQAYLASMGLVALAYGAGLDLTIVAERYLQLLVSAILLGVIVSLLLYIKSFSAPITELVPEGNTGRVISDYYMGRELNPKIGDLDLKFVFMMRVGFLSWGPIHACMLAWAFKTYGYLPLPLILITIFHVTYAADLVLEEDFDLTTRESISTGLGYAVVCGELTWVPFVYIIQAYFLLRHPQPLSWPGAAAIAALFFIGFWIYRSSNAEKNGFRKNPNHPDYAHLQKISTAHGKSLLVSGWWGWLRHPNYLGDIIMAVAWALPCGVSHLAPYVYLLFCITILVERDAVDEEDCRRKYGPAWLEYCRRVKYRIVPYVY
ncbi:delta(14)-sterol reductase TM7SF2-like [Lethenteron reissneri]|uniref:delta(14)-sterol reductase TM7SF2-like n=1 Tax=Lethenteron reissneri TaxID=7753 RepID=UPI002AB756F5|nr:delta(14)-sterol reductase TM7SF2-like [Lethenteron reissneri]